MDVVGILIATVVAFIISFVFYAVAPAAPATVETPPVRPRVWQLLVEVLRSAVTATLVTGLLFAGAWSGPAAGALLGLALWVLPVVLLTGSVVWENVPVRTAALHVTDWLIKLLAIGAIVGAFA
ncbi:DUF1761 family protein [Actinoplanes aureus]|uniref:DUF1761 family protein n=1 Tax=Actinoplanes aureus TaxID=2792083 RepID=A0A931CIP0_9ACTN|nr:DUF1761 family protein [Actinoplanes aureus]MBG0567831.1 DUF1761 family protein [Actinoplanes aureus]